MDHLALLLAILSAVLTVVGGWLVWRVLDREVKDETQGWQQARRQCQQAVLTSMSVAEGAALAPCGAQAAGIARAIDLADKGILSFHVGKRLVVTLRAPQLARQPAERLLLHRVFDRVEIGQTARVGASSRWDDADRILASNADDRLVQRGSSGWVWTTTSDGTWRAWSPARWGRSSWPAPRGASPGGRTPVCSECWPAWT